MTLPVIPAWPARSANVALPSMLSSLPPTRFGGKKRALGEGEEGEASQAQPRSLALTRRSTRTPRAIDRFDPRPQSYREQEQDAKRTALLNAYGGPTRREEEAQASMDALRSRFALLNEQLHAEIEAEPNRSEVIRRLGELQAQWLELSEQWNPLLLLERVAEAPALHALANVAWPFAGRCVALRSDEKPSAFKPWTPGDRHNRN